MIRSIKKDFNRNPPRGRYRKDGWGSGEEFREMVLEPALKARRKRSEIVELDLEGVTCKEWLKGVFYDYVRKEKYPPDMVRSMIKIKDGYIYHDLIWELMEEAEEVNMKGSFSLGIF